MLTYMVATDSRHLPSSNKAELTRVESIRSWFHHDHLFIDKVCCTPRVQHHVCAFYRPCADTPYNAVQAFDQERWKLHRTWRRHLPEGFTFLRVLHTLGWPVFFYVAISLVVCCYAEWAEVSPPLAKQTDDILCNLP